jgi:hypothetical protein
VRALVDEFSVLARFPASRPQPASLNNLVEGALVMFNGRLEGIRVRTELAHDLPAVMADPEAIKRAVANLVDNAAEAMQDAMLKEITISTSLVASRDAVELVVSDTGLGVSRDVKERLVPALLFDQATRHGTRAGHCQQNCGRPSWLDPRGRKQAGRQPLRDRVAGGGGNGQALRQRASRPSLVVSRSRFSLSREKPSRRSEGLQR